MFTYRINGKELTISINGIAAYKACISFEKGAPSTADQVAYHVNRLQDTFLIH